MMFGTPSDAAGFAAHLASTTDLSEVQIAVLVRLATEGMRGDDSIELSDRADQMFRRWRMAE